MLCGVLHFMTAPGQTTGVSVFIDPMIDGLGLTRSQVSTAYMIGTLSAALMQPLFGRLFDRKGPRRSTLLIGAVFGFVLIAMAGVTGFVTLVLGFFGIRALGQGGLSVVAGTTPALWFDRRRGIAIASSTAIGSVGNSMVPLITAAVIAVVGWRATWLVYAAAVWIVVLSIGRWGLINSPGAVGQHLDGIPPRRDVVAEQRPADTRDDLRDEVASASSPMTAAPDGDPDTPGGLAGKTGHAATVGTGFTRAEAMRTPIFWAVTGAVATGGLTTTALTFHQISILGEQGLTTIEAATNFVPQTVAALIATLAFGTLIDRVRQRYLLVFTMALIATAMVGVRFVAPGVLALLYGLVLGAGQGAMRSIGGASYAKLFGTRAAGEIRGVAKMISSGASAFGPVALALGFALTGSYRQVLVAMLLLPAGASTLALLAPEVRKPVH